MSRIAEIVQAIISEDAVTASDLIVEELNVRALERIEQLKITVASDMFSEAACSSSMGKRQINGEYDEMEDDEMEDDEMLDEIAGLAAKSLYAGGVGLGYKALGSAGMKRSGSVIKKAGSAIKKSATEYMRSGKPSDLIHSAAKAAAASAAGVAGATAAHKALKEDLEENDDRNRVVRKSKPSMSQE
jgi:hypothetical protein